MVSNGPDGDRATSTFPAIRAEGFRKRTLTVRVGRSKTKMCLATQCTRWEVRNTSPYRNACVQSYDQMKRTSSARVKGQKKNRKKKRNETPPSVTVHCFGRRYVLRAETRVAPRDRRFEIGHRAPHNRFGQSTSARVPTGIDVFRDRHTDRALRLVVMLSP